MKDKYSLIAVIIFFVLLMGLSCDRPSDQLNDRPKEEHINITIEEEDVVEPEEEKKEEEENEDVPIDYDVEDEVLPEGYN